MSAASRPATELSAAATVVLLREASDSFEVLLMQRAEQLAFHGGAWVFPGGRVDPGDGGEGDALRSAMRAGARETHEEAGVVIDHEALIPFSHWTTPPGRSRRFATWFFATQLARDASVRVDGSEMRDHRWLRPADALVAHAQRQLELPPPTFVTLTELSQHRHVQGVLECARRKAPPFFLPRPVAIEGGWLSLYAGDVAYEQGEPDQLGPRHRLCMLDSGWRYERSLSSHE